MSDERLAYSVTELAALLNIGRNAAYDLANRTDFPAIRIGDRRIIIPKAGLELWLERHMPGGGLGE